MLKSIQYSEFDFQVQPYEGGTWVVVFKGQPIGKILNTKAEGLQIRRWIITALSSILKVLDE